MTASRVLLLSLLVLACVGLGVGVVAASGRDPSTGDPSTGAGSPSDSLCTGDAAGDGPVAVLRDWDRRRAAAWAAGDVRRLRSLYVPGSTAADADAARLRRWVDRGLRVPALRTQLLRVRVLVERADRLVLAVVDRVVRAEVTGAAEQLRLPADAPTAWRIALRRDGGTWRVASVRR